MLHARTAADEATLIGENSKVSVSSAIIANETMIRYLDFNDVLYFPKSPGKIGGAHPAMRCPPPSPSANASTPRARR